jgi:ribosome-associated heat shock protein Hsp15
MTQALREDARLARGAAREAKSPPSPRTLRRTVTETRLDRWLWAARLFKTRALAAKAVTGGKIHLNGARSKPAKPTRVGDQLAIRRGACEIVVTIRALSERRGPAAVAAALYEETEASRSARAAIVARLREESPGPPDRGGRPSKRERRASLRLRRGR